MSGLQSAASSVSLAGQAGKAASSPPSRLSPSQSLPHIPTSIGTVWRDDGWASGRRWHPSRLPSAAPPSPLHGLASSECLPLVGARWKGNRASWRRQRPPTSPPLSSAAQRDDIHLISPRRCFPHLPTTSPSPLCRGGSLPSLLCGSLPFLSNARWRRAEFSSVIGALFNLVFELFDVNLSMMFDSMMWSYRWIFWFWSMNSLILYRELVSFLLLNFSIYFWWLSIISSARVEPAFFFFKPYISMVSVKPAYLCPPH